MTTRTVATSPYGADLGRISAIYTQGGDITIRDEAGIFGDRVSVPECLCDLTGNKIRHVMLDFGFE